mmetsp:Transcript_16182/g.39966  ORF Transcript_16182/g.39966 Transcript_16182/m.39966 type:complete len:131 (-) Transcript_16182:248-640(-)
MARSNANFILGLLKEPPRSRRRSLAVKSTFTLLSSMVLVFIAIRETLTLLGRIEGCVVKGVVVALDRQESVVDHGETSAIEQIEKEFGIPVVSIICLEDLLQYVVGRGGEAANYAEQMREYRERYGVGKK